MNLSSRLALLALLFGVTTLTAQNRNFNAENIVIDDNNGNTITISAPAGMTGDWTFVLPADGGTAGQVLTSDGAGGFSWAAPGGGGGGSIPAGYMILNTSPTAPAGFSAAGSFRADSWAVRAAMPTGRRGMAVGVVNSKIYVIGGSVGAGVSAVNEEYDPATNTWAARAAMTTARCWPAGAVYNNRIYVFGGSSAGGAYTGPLGTNEEYNPATNTWAPKAAMPTPAMLVSAATVGAKIHVIGGFDGTNDRNNNREYDPVANTWAARAALPAPRDGVGIGVIAGKIYIAGGYKEAPANSFNIVAEVNEYDPGTNAWSTKTSMPAPRWTPGSTVLNSKFFVIGGSEGANTCFSYDPTVDLWQVNNPMGAGREQCVAAVVGTRLFAIGGTGSADFGPGLSTTEEYSDVTLYLFSKD